MLVIGLTGLIGSGKTTVAKLFASHGVAVIDTDELAHSLTAAHGGALPALRARFGAEIFNPDASLNRRVLRQLVFADPLARSDLEHILHPLIFNAVAAKLAELQAVIAAADQSDTIVGLAARAVPYVLLVVPLLFRSERYLGVTHRNIFVDCPYPELVNRLAARSQLSQSEVDAILATQVARETQLDLADDVIINNGDRAQLIDQVSQLHHTFMLLR